MSALGISYPNTSANDEWCPLKDLIEESLPVTW